MSKFMVFLILVLLLIPTMATSLALHTNTRWIVDESGERLKLACVNWAAHMEVMVAEGLSYEPVDMISKKIVSMGFNCVRLTWPLFLVTGDDFLGSVTVKQSFQRLGLVDFIGGFEVNNPSLLNLLLIHAFQAVVSNLGENNVMVILDNHVSKPEWCCGYSDDDGFFGDLYFNSNLWIKGLTRMATIFNGVPNVIGMSLRNELRGPKQNINDWYRYMQEGAEAVHSANPNVLVILSGLDYDQDLSFLLKLPLNISFTGKLVYEVHWYGFWEAWENGNPNEMCGSAVRNVMRGAGFLLEQGWPLMVSEFGMDLRGSNVNDNRYFNCFISWVAEVDLDWALWTLVGSYYLREGVIHYNEPYGILDWNWHHLRNSTFLHRIKALQSPFQGPGLSETRPHKVIFHPLTGLCILRKSMVEPLTLGPCSESESWNYTPRKGLTIKGTYFCLQADMLDEAARLSIICNNPSSKWETISDSNMHLSSKLKNGSNICLDVDSGNNIVTRACKCLSKDNSCEPESQWFKLVTSTRRSTRSMSWLQRTLSDG